MKKNELKKLAALGLCTGLLISSHLAHAADAEKEQKNKNIDFSKADSDYHLMTEQELLLELNPQGKAMYNSLDAEGKDLARKVASQKCSNQNVCKNLNACESTANSCAGKGGCKGKGKCAFADKNLAVKIVQEKLMKEKRVNATK